MSRSQHLKTMKKMMRVKTEHTQHYQNQRLTVLVVMLSAKSRCCLVDDVFFCADAGCRCRIRAVIMRSQYNNARPPPGLYRRGAISFDSQRRIKIGDHPANSRSSPSACAHNSSSLV